MDKVNRADDSNLPHGHPKPLQAGMHTAYSRRPVSLALMGRYGRGWDHSPTTLSREQEISLNNTGPVR